MGRSRPNGPLQASSPMDTLPRSVVALGATKAERQRGPGRAFLAGERGNTSVGIKTVVQHRDRLIRAGLVYVLDREPDIDVVGEARDPAALVHLCTLHRPDNVVLEVDATEWDPARLVAALCKRQRTLRAIGVHDGVDAEQSRRLYKAGLRHTVSYAMGSESVLAAVRGRHLKASPTPLPRSAGPVEARSTLTPREAEVLTLIAQGFRTSEIAAALDISLKTVENHKQRLFRKLDVQNQAHAVSVAMRQGLLPAVARANG